MSFKINANMAFDGVSEVVKDASIVTHNSKIVYFGTQEGSPNTDKIINTEFAMPGLWDSHVHYSGLYRAAFEDGVFTAPEVLALRCAWDVKETLKSGITSVREVGGNGIYLKKAIQEGAIIGPRIYGAGRILSTTGGHGDLHGLPLDVHGLIHTRIGELADGVGECLKAVRNQLRSGAEIIKFCASGGVMSELDHPIHQQFSQIEQNAIIEEASRAEVAVAAHCHGAPGIKAAIIAGVTSIEHGTYLNDELADLMVEKDTILVPTRYVMYKLAELAPKMGVPQYAIDKLNAIGDIHLDAIKLAIKKGIKIAMGTDMFTSGPNAIFRYGENAMELELLVKAGMKPIDALKAGTSMGPQTLGKKAPKSGCLKPDFDADLLLLNKNPLDDMSSIYKRDNIQNVIKQGQIVLF